MADIQGMLRDPEYQGLPFEQRRQLLSEADPDFASAPSSAQVQILNEMKRQDWWQGGAKAKASKPKQAPADPYAGLKDFGRNSLTAIGAGLGGVGGFFTPVPGGLAAGTLLGGGVGKLAGDTIFGEQQPQAPRVNPAKGKGFGANVAEAVKNIPSSAASTVYGGLGMVGDLSRATMDQATGVNPQAGMQTLTGMADMFKNLGKTDEWVMNPVGNLATLGMVAGPTVKGAQAVGRGARKLNSKIGFTPDNEIRGLSQVHDVPLTVGEITARPGIVSLETQLERVPVVGTRKFRKTQSGKLQDAAERVVEKYTPAETSNLPENIQRNMTGSLSEGKKQVNAAYEDFRTRLANSGIPDAIDATTTRKAAQSLKDEVPDLFKRLPGDTVEQKLTIVLDDTSGKNMTFRDAMSLREKLSDYIQRAYDQRGAVGNNEMRILTILRSAIDKDIENWGNHLGKKDLYHYKGELVEPLKLKAELDNNAAIVQDLLQKGGTSSLVQEAQLYYAGKKQSQMMRMVKEPQAQYEERLLKRYAQDTGKTQAAFDPNSPQGKRIAELQNRNAQINETLANMNLVDQTTRKPVVDAFKGANQLYQDKIVPFLDHAIKKATKEDFDTDQLMSTFIKPSRPNLAAKMMGTLDKEGQQMVRYAILKDAFDNASAVEAKTGNKVPFSPAKLAGRIEQLGSTLDAVYGRQDATYLRGFAKLARASERAGQFAENPPTGLRASDTGISAGVAGGLVTHPLATAGSLASIKTLSYLLTSEKGKNLLLRAYRTPESSRGMNDLLGKMGRIIPSSVRQYAKDVKQGGKIELPMPPVGWSPEGGGRMK